MYDSILYLSHFEKVEAAHRANEKIPGRTEEIIQRGRKKRASKGDPRKEQSSTKGDRKKKT